MGNNVVTKLISENRKLREENAYLRRTIAIREQTAVQVVMDSADAAAFEYFKPRPTKDKQPEDRMVEFHLLMNSYVAEFLKEFIAENETTQYSKNADRTPVVTYEKIDRLLHEAFGRHFRGWEKRYRANE